ncbi:MAG TPA: transposase, partial [Bacteroidales bacterium]|nr:transposase [Bacteroidales bacterium]
SAADNETLRQLISDYANDILLLMEQIESLKNTLSKQKGITREIEILESFIGIARYSAVGLMIEIEEIERFPSTKKISSFFGLHPKFKQSGDKTSGIKMSKQGSAQVRAILYMVAKSALVDNRHIRKIYDRFKEQGMSHNQAMGVVMHKILRIIYGMLKSNTTYAPAYDLERQQLSVAYHRKGNDSKRSNSSSKKYKEIDLEAPISKRQRRKRKEQLSSPSS